MKVCLTADLHFGISKGDPVFLESQLRYINELVKICLDKEIKNVYILGDLFDTRNTLNVLVLNKVLDFFYSHENDPLRFTISLGNHDIYYRDRLSPNSLQTIRNVKNVRIIDKPTMVMPDTLMIPWIIDLEDFNNNILPNYSCKRLFCHIDTIGTLGDSLIVKDNFLDPNELFKSWDYIYSGHYHNHSIKKCGDKYLMYLGSPYPMNRGEAAEPHKGLWILDTETEELEFIKNPHAIEYIYLTFPEKPTNLDKLVKGNIVTITIPRSYSKKTSEINEYVEYLNKLNPARSVSVVYENLVLNQEYLELDDAGLEEKLSEFRDLNLTNLVLSYVKGSEEIVNNENDIVTSLLDLYDRI